MRDGEKETIHSSRVADILSKVIRVAAYPLAAAAAYFAGDLHARNNIYRNFARHGFFDGRASESASEEAFAKPSKGRGGVQGAVHKQYINIARDGYEGRLLSAQTSEEIDRYIKNAVRFDVFSVKDIEGIAAKGNKPAITERLGVLGDTVHDFQSAFIKEANHVGGRAEARLAGLQHTYRVAVREFFEDLGIKGPRSYFRVSSRNQQVGTAFYALTAGGIILGVMLTAANSRGLLDALAEKFHHKEKNDTPALRG